jgi:hypothetical protein
MTSPRTQAGAGASDPHGVSVATRLESAAERRPQARQARISAATYRECVSADFVNLTKCRSCGGVLR